jgi:hypothetical protein
VQFLYGKVPNKFGRGFEDLGVKRFDTKSKKYGHIEKIRKGSVELSNR